MNFYVEKIGTEGVQHKTALFPTPGLQSWSTVPELGGRAGISIGSRAFTVMGTALYEVFENKTMTKRGTVAIDSFPAQIAYNGPTGNQLAIASGGHIYNYDLTTNTLTLVVSGGGHMVGMLDEYFIALNILTGRVRLSNLNDGTTWDPTQFALRSAQADPWTAMVINPPDIWLFGDRTGDVWYDAGTSPFPLAARTGLNIPYGIIAPFSLALTGGQIFWLASNKDGAGLVVRAQGYAPEKISTVELDTALSVYQRTSRITDAESMVYQQEGHTFYVLRFPAANATWCYDLTTGIWHERGTWNSAEGRYDVWHPRMHLYAYGLHLTGDATGILSVMDVTYAAEADGMPIRRLRRGPILLDENNRMPLGRFELGMETGLGLSTGQGSNPVVMARFSMDGGHNWSNERQATAGKIGDYRKRVFWTRLGSPRLWVPEIVVTDPVPWRVVDAWINNTEEAAA